MKRKKGRDCRIELPPQKMRWIPDPHRRARVIPNKHKVYNRKALAKVPSEPSDVSGLW
jgi:hypothetical protein